MFTTGEVVKEKEDTKTKSLSAQANEGKYKKTKKSIEDRIESLQKEVKTAEDSVNQAQAEVDKLKEASTKSDPSIWEEINRVQRRFPDNPAVRGESFE